MKILRIDAVASKTGLSKGSIYKQIKLKTFPQGIKITARASGWSSDAVDSWIESKVKGETTNVK